MKPLYELGETVYRIVGESGRFSIESAIVIGICLDIGAKQIEYKTHNKDRITHDYEIKLARFESEAVANKINELNAVLNKNSQSLRDLLKKDDC